MKVKRIIVPMLLMACAQTTFAQKIVLHLSNQQKVEYHVMQIDSISYTNTQSNNSGIALIGNMWDLIQHESYLSKLKAYIENKRPGTLFYNKDYMPLKGGENWDMVLKCLNAQIHERDSSYIMVMPTDHAWDKAKEKLAPLYRYADKYEDRVASEEYGFTNTRTIQDPDSLAKLSMEMDITSPLVFNQHEQPEDDSYMVSTHGDTLHSTPTWDKNNIINGKIDGYYGNKSWCCMATEWDYPKEYYFPDVEVDINDKAFYGTESGIFHKIGEDSRKIDFDCKRFADIADKYGYVGNNDFFWLTPFNATSDPVVSIKLTNNIMSGKYDVYVVMVPYWYTRLAEEGFADSVRNSQAFVDSISATSKMSFKAKMRYNNNASQDVMSKFTQDFEYDGTKVDTIKIFENFEFPYSYKNLRYSYPTLMLAGATKATKVKQGFMYPLCIDRIILKSKEE